MYDISVVSYASYTRGGKARQYMHTKRHQRHTGRDGDKTSLFEDTGESTEASSCRPIAPCSFGGMDARNSAETSVRGNQEGM